jgi:DNA-binding SARP family transcriptional activator/pimeloyl-ACP methyl ester carboxylesterase
MVGRDVALRLLGPVELVAADGRASVLGERQRSLLAVLAAGRGRPQPAELLADALWPGELDRGAALHTQISRLRKALEEAGSPIEIVTGPAGYTLRIEQDRVDAGRFESLLDQADAAADPARRARLLGEALALWRGPAFGPDADHAAVHPEAVRLDERCASTWERRGDALVAAGQDDVAIAELEAFVSTEPLREEALATLLTALYRRGRHAEALAHVRRHRAHLADELGLEPSASLQRLELDILRHDVDAPPATPVDHVGLGNLSIHYAVRADGGRVAHATVGDGPSVVSVPAWVTSLEVVAAGRDPRSTVLEHLARRCRLTMYDRLGTGLSPGTVDDFSLDASVDELVAVLDDVGPATLLAMSQAGPVAIAAARRRPDVVTGLVLFGTFASASRTFRDARTSRAAVELLRANASLGTRLLAGLYRPDSSDRATEHLSRVMRDSAPIDVAIGYLETMYEHDVSDLLPAIGQPTLVMHYTHDAVVPFRGGQQLAAGIPDAEFVPLAGRFHLPDLDDLERIVGGIADVARTGESRSGSRATGESEHRS